MAPRRGLYYLKPWHLKPWHLKPFHVKQGAALLSLSGAAAKLEMFHVKQSHVKHPEFRPCSPEEVTWESAPA